MDLWTLLHDAGTRTVVAICGVAGFSAATIAFYHKWVKPVRSLAIRVLAALDDHPKMVKSIEHIQHEVTTNSGSSLKDAILAMRSEVAGIGAMQRAKIESDQGISFYTDPVGEVVAVTLGYTRLTGLTTTEAQHGGWRLAIHPDDLERVVQAWNEAIGHKMVFVQDIRYRDAEKGGATLTRVTATPYFVANEAKGWVGRVEVLAAPVRSPDPDAMKAVDEHMKRRNL